MPKRVFLKAMADIKAGEELLVSYGASYWANFNNNIVVKERIAGIGKQKDISTLVNQNGYLILGQGHDENLDSIICDLCNQIPREACGKEKYSILTRINDGTPLLRNEDFLEHNKLGYPVHVKLSRDGNPVRYEQKINSNMTLLHQLSLWFDQHSTLTEGKNFHGFSPNLIQNHEDWARLSIPPQQLHRDYFSKWYLQEKESGGDSFSVFVAIGGEFEISIQGKSHLSAASDSILPTARVKVPKNCMLIMHALLRHGGLSGHSRLHMYMSTSEPLNEENSVGTACTNFSF